MTDDQIKLALSLATVRFGRHTKKQRFAAKMEWQALNEPEKEITDGEFIFLCLLVMRSHKQLPANVVKLAHDHIGVLNAKGEVA